MKKLKKKYVQSYNLILKIVNLIDPIGLIAGGAPKNEYDIEINKILIAIQGDNEKKSITEKIYNIFCDSFDETIAGEKNNYEKIAEKILHLKSNGKL